MSPMILFGIVSIICGFSGVVEAQYGREEVVTRLVALAGRDAPNATLEGVIESGRLAQGEEVTRAYTLRQGSCYWFMSVGDGNLNDLDVFIRYRGVVVIRDQSETNETVVPGERPYCPGEDQQVQVRVVAFRGGGSYATAIYRAGEQGLNDEQRGASDLNLLLDRAALRYAGGMGQTEQPRQTRLEEGENLAIEMRLEAGMCYRVVAVGGAGVEDLALQLFQGSAEVGHDDAVASEAVASYCATADSSIRVRLRMERGHGEIMLAPYSGGRNQGTRHVRTLQSVPVGGAESDFLSRELRSLHSRVGQDREGVSPVLRANLRTSQDQVFPVELEGGRCYTIIAVGAPSVRDVDLFFIDPRGAEIQREDGPSNSSTIDTQPCPRWSGTYSVRVRVHAGYGNVAVQVFGN